MKSKLVLKNIVRSTLLFGGIVLTVEKLIELPTGTARNICLGMLALIEFPLLIAGVQLHQLELHQWSAIPANAVAQYLQDNNVLPSHV